MPTGATGTPPRNQGNPALLHRFLGFGLVIMAVGLVVARQSGVMGDSPPESASLSAYTLAGVSVLMCAAALMFLKPLVPRRRAGQTPEAYWTDRSVVPKAFLVWFMLEGAGVLASISYFLSGSPIAVALIVATVAVYWLNGPGVFENE